MHKRHEHHLLIPSQYMGGGPRVKAFRGCDLVVGRKRGLFWGSHLSFFRERCPAGMTSHPKEVSMDWNHLMHVIKVGDERELDPYPEE